MLSPSQRRQRALILKKSLHKRLRSRKRLADKMPPREILLKRAQKMAVKKAIVKFKLIPLDLMSKYPSGLNISQKMSLERRLGKPEIKKAIKKFTKSSYRLVVRKVQSKLQQQLEQQ